MTEKTKSKSNLNDRQKAGAYLRHLRKTVGLTQSELARLVRFEWCSMVGQIESGKTGLPPDKMRLYADALGVDHQTFGKRLLFNYAPHFWEMIFERSGRSDCSQPT